jgi:hypothetical protein
VQQETPVNVPRVVEEDDKANMAVTTYENQTVKAEKAHSTSSEELKAITAKQSLQIGHSSASSQEVFLKRFLLHNGMINSLFF